MITRRIQSIVVEGRHRTDLGEVDPLAESIRSVGLLHPVVVTEDGRLVAGARRLEACKVLGWDEVPVTVAESWDEASAALIAERDENTCRKQMTASELASLGRSLEDIYRPEAAANTTANLPGQTPNGSREPLGRVREQVGEALGMSGATYQRIKTVADDAADSTLPAERRAAAADALEAMDNGRPVRPAYAEYRDEHVEPADAPAPVDLPALDTKRQRDIANANKDRAWRVVSGVSGVAQSLDSIKPQYVIAACDPAEISEMHKVLSQAIADLRQFRNVLRGV